jgi:hypothetical protein
MLDEGKRHCTLTTEYDGVPAFSSSRMSIPRGQLIINVLDFDDLPSNPESLGMLGDIELALISPPRWSPLSFIRLSH